MVETLDIDKQGTLKRINLELRELADEMDRLNVNRNDLENFKYMVDNDNADAYDDRQFSWLLIEIDPPVNPPCSNCGKPQSGVVHHRGEHFCLPDCINKFSARNPGFLDVSTKKWKEVE